MNPPSPHSSLLAQAAGLLASAQRILFITGAGLSADSGLPTYRGVGGLYEGQLTEMGIPIEQALSGQMFKRRPEVTWQYLARIEAACRGARPNVAHYAMARLEAMHGGVTVLTQNIDGFHTQAGSHDVIEIHGSLHTLRCTACARTRQVESYAGLALPPECPHCGGMLRPEVVLFGENLPEAAVQRYEAVLAAGPDLVISVGTGSAFPYIAGPVIWAAEAGIPTIEINPGHTPVSAHVEIQLPLRAAEALPALLEAAGLGLGASNA